MNNNIISLNKIPTNSLAIIVGINNTGITRRRMLDLGFIEGTKVESLRRSPMGDPTAYQVRGAVIALREEEASRILVKQI